MSGMIGKHVYHHVHAASGIVMDVTTSTDRQGTQWLLLVALTEGGDKNKLVVWTHAACSIDVPTY